MCVAIQRGASPDVIEIDGASNTGIDDIRALRERAAFAPSEGRFKVYIIDEVHRLSVQAFDGLLKTLEEPPAHVLFVFASTQPEKVPTTILSRCQRFDFHKISRVDTVGRLQQVATKEGIDVSTEAVELIAQRSEGSLRDALGLLDQVHAFTGGTISAEDVRESIGLGTPTTIASIASHMLDQDPGLALNLIHEAVAGGADPRFLWRQLVEYWRWLLLAVSGAPESVDADPALAASLQAHAARVTGWKVVEVLHALTEQVIEPRLSVPPELPLELACVQGIMVLSAGPVRDPEPSAASHHSPVAGDESSPNEAEPQKPSSRASTERVAESPALGPTLGSDEPEPAPPEDPPEMPDPTALRESGPGSQRPVDASWAEIKSAMRGRSQSLYALLRDATPTSWSETHVAIAWPYRFHREEMNRPENRKILEDVIGGVTGRRLKVECLQASKEEIRALVGGAGPSEDDGFIEEVERALKGVHAQQLRNSSR